MQTAQAQSMHRSMHKHACSCDQICASWCSARIMASEMPALQGSMEGDHPNRCNSWHAYQLVLIRKLAKSVACALRPAAVGAVLPGNSTVTFRTQPVPVPGPGQVSLMLLRDCHKDC